MQAKLDAGLVNGVLNMETGRVRKWRNNGQRQGVAGEDKVNSQNFGGNDTKTT